MIRGHDEASTASLQTLAAWWRLRNNQRRPGYRAKCYWVYVRKVSWLRLLWRPGYLARKAKTQNGAFTAATMASFMKAAVSLTGITSSVTKPQMLLFQSELGKGLVSISHSAVLKKRKINGVNNFLKEYRNNCACDRKEKVYQQL